MRTKTKGWNKQRREKQAQNIQKTRPWTKTTGPRTPEGKAAITTNALKHGTRSATFITLRKTLRAQRTALTALSLDTPRKSD